MSAEVDWVLDVLQDVVDAQPNDHLLKRVDRDDSEVLEGDIRKRSSELRQANYVGATLADRSPTAEIQGEYRAEAVVGLRIEGLHSQKQGQVDPSGENGVPWQPLVEEIRSTIRAQRSYPSVDGLDVDYHTVLITNEAPQSVQYSDYYRHDADLLLRGHS